jgi:hypothetical protein
MELIVNLFVKMQNLYIFAILFMKIKPTRIPWAGSKYCGTLLRIQKEQLRRLKRVQNLDLYIGSIKEVNNISSTA